MALPHHTIPQLKLHRICTEDNVLHLSVYFQQLLGISAGVCIVLCHATWESPSIVFCKSTCPVFSYTELRA